jgi:hypothetical protein
MSVTVNVNGVAISYPQTGDSEWGDEATDFAIQVGAVLQKIGQGNQSTTNNIVIGSISSPGNLTVASGNTDLGGTLDVTGVTTIVDDLIVDTDTLFVDVSTDRVGINTATPTEALDVTGKILVSSDITVGGVIVVDDSTNVTTAPPIAFTGDLNTGIGHSAADTLDFVTDGVSRARISSTGLQSSVVPDLSGSNTNLFPEYKCRAWVNFNGTGSVGSQTIRGSGNVSGVTKNSTGDYTVNIDIDMPDVNYSVAITVGDTASPNPNRNGSLKTAPSVGSFTIVTGVPSTGSTQDMAYVFCEVFR